MALHVTLVPDPLKGEGALRPRVVQTDTVDMDALLHYMATDTALEETDMRAAVSRLSDALVFYLTRGERVKTPLGTFHLSVFLIKLNSRISSRSLPEKTTGNSRVSSRSQSDWIVPPIGVLL